MLYVTGITGHSGTWFLERLNRENYTGCIRCLVRKGSNTDALDRSGLNIQKITGDLNDPSVLLESMVGVDTVVHISSIVHSRSVVDAAITKGVGWVILVHTTGRFSKYKSAAQEYIDIEDNLLKKRDQIDITVLRPTMIYGSSMDRNMYKLIDYLYHHKLFPMFGQGHNVMQLVHARDLGNAYYDVFINKQATVNKEYNLSGGKAIKYIDLVKCVSHALGKNHIVVTIPLSLSLAAAKIYNFINRNAIISVEQVLRMQEDKAFSFGAATRDFGYAPISFAEGIIGEVEEYVSHQKRGNSQ
jgi:nucleoside-diphosphate-sugar epimerase